MTISGTDGGTSQCRHENDVMHCVASSSDFSLSLDEALTEQSAAYPIRAGSLAFPACTDVVNLCGFNQWDTGPLCIITCRSLVWTESSLAGEPVWLSGKPQRDLGGSKPLRLSFLFNLKIVVRCGVTLPVL